MTEKKAHVFSIPPAMHFLEGLALVLKNGNLAPQFFVPDDPLALACVTVYLPTRRAARRLQVLLLEQEGGEAVVLPKIRILGEHEQEEIDFHEMEMEEDHNHGFPLSQIQPVSSTDRLLLLTALVRKWKQRLPLYLSEYFNEENISVPSSLGEAIWLARDLARIMDEVDLKGARWEGLQELETHDFGGWGKIMLDFLSIVTTHWPAILKERNECNPGSFSAASLRAQALRLKKNPPRGLVVAAGSTGSLPATAEFLATVAQLPCGAVVLPGLDKKLDDTTWHMISSASHEAWAFTHPQYTLAQLLSKIGISRRDVQELFISEGDLATREALTSEILRPVETTDVWFKNRTLFHNDKISEALSNVSLIEALNEREEAVAIAVALRHATDCRNATAALITPDRDLARRVCAELKGFGIIANDSGGRPFCTTPQGSLLCFLVKAFWEPGDPVTILSLLKHPFVGLGFTADEIGEAVRSLELFALRGSGTGYPDIFSLRSFYEEQHRNLQGTRKKPWPFLCHEKAYEKTCIVLEKLHAALTPLEEIRNSKISCAEAIRQTRLSLEELCRNENGKSTLLFEGDAGEKLSEFLEKLESAQTDFMFPAQEWPEMLQTLMALETLRPKHGDARIFIWGVLEARLQNADTLILGGLNEGLWPRKPKGDPLMSRMMRKKVGLDPPEWRIGLAAHDFEMAMGNARLILSRSLRAGEAPSMPSRWLQRLLTFIGPEETGCLQKRGQIFIHWSRLRDSGEKRISISRPAPCPDLSLRPRHFSVSEIETLRRDPYAIYARRILGLRPLDPLLRDPGAAERGTLFHRILHLFNSSQINPASKEAQEHFLDLARQCFQKENLSEELYGLWLARFEKLAPNFLKLEKKRRERVYKSYSELSSCRVGIGSSGVTLSGRADRIDLLHSGKVDIIDYKTGFSPSCAQAHTLLAPQLALEAALLEKGAFGADVKGDIENLLFIRLKPDGQVVEETILKHKHSMKSAQELAQEVWQHLEKLVQYYNDPDTVYVSRALPLREEDMEGDYDHLARVAEWSAGTA